MIPRLPRALLALALGACGSDPAADAATAHDAGPPPVDAALPDAARPDWDAGSPPPPHPAEHCAYFLTGEVDLRGDDADGDGVPNGWDHCPNNPADALDSDRDGIGNRADDDVDGDGALDADDPDDDGDGAADADEAAAGTDPLDPSSLPGLARVEHDPGILWPLPGWYRGDLHVHTEASHDSTEALADYAEPMLRAGLHFAWITDHRVLEAPFTDAWREDRVLFVPGIEWGGPGHANVGGVRTNNEARYDDADDVRRAWRLARLQGAVQSLNHYGADGDYWDALFARAPDLLDAVDVMEVWNIWWTLNASVNERSLARWDAWLREGRRIAAVGGSDVHSADVSVAFPTTLVHARSLSIPGILDGLRRGRTYVAQSLPYLGRGALSFAYEGRPELDFRIDADGDGEPEAMLGDVIAPGPVALRVAVRHAHGPVVVIRGGEELARFDEHEPGADVEHTLADDAPPGTYYRIEMRESAAEGAAMLLLSSPIYVAR